MARLMRMDQQALQCLVVAGNGVAQPDLLLWQLLAQARTVRAPLEVVKQALAQVVATANVEYLIPAGEFVDPTAGRNQGQLLCTEGPDTPQQIDGVSGFRFSRRPRPGGSP